MKIDELLLLVGVLNIGLWLMNYLLQERRYKEFTFFVKMQNENMRNIVGCFEAMGANAEIRKNSFDDINNKEFEE